MSKKKKKQTLLVRHSLREGGFDMAQFQSIMALESRSRSRRCLLLTSQRIRKQEVEAGRRYHLQTLPLPLNILQPPQTGTQVGTKFANT